MQIGLHGFSPIMEALKKETPSKIFHPRLSKEYQIAKRSVQMDWPSKKNQLSKENQAEHLQVRSHRPHLTTFALFVPARDLLLIFGHISTPPPSCLTFSSFPSNLLRLLIDPSNWSNLILGGETKKRKKDDSDEFENDDLMNLETPRTFEPMTQTQSSGSTQRKSIPLKIMIPNPVTSKKPKDPVPITSKTPKDSVPMTSKTPVVPKGPVSQSGTARAASQTTSFQTSSLLQLINKKSPNPKKTSEVLPPKPLSQAPAIIRPKRVTTVNRPYVFSCLWWPLLTFQYWLASPFLNPWTWWGDTGWGNLTTVWFSDGSRIITEIL